MVEIIFHIATAQTKFARDARDRSRLVRQHIHELTAERHG
jgi:hypothetical protein